MTIAYVANIRLPTERAHGYQLMRVCNELARQGHGVTLYVPLRQAATQDPFAFYGLEKNFTVVYVPCRNWIRFARMLGSAAYFLQSFSFLRALARQGALAHPALIYTRDREAVWYFARRGYACVWSAHNWPRRAYLARYLLRRARGVVCNSQGTEVAVCAALAFPTAVVPNAADPNPFAGGNKQMLRAELGLPPAKKLALYAGHLYGWKGGEILLEAAQLLAGEPDILIVVIGGRTEDIERYKAKSAEVHNVLVLGYQPKASVPKFLAAADALLLPNTAATEESVSYTSPLKLFEYLAAGVPIVASNLPSVREALTEQEAFLVPAGDAAAFAAAVRQAVYDPAAETKAAAALAESQRHTWYAHAQALAQFFSAMSTQPL